jgi:hypothetical protein
MPTLVPDDRCYWRVSVKDAVGNLNPTVGSTFYIAAFIEVAVTLVDS